MADSSEYQVCVQSDDCSKEYTVKVCKKSSRDKTEANIPKDESFQPDSDATEKVDPYFSELENAFIIACNEIKKNCKNNANKILVEGIRIELSFDDTVLSYSVGCFSLAISVFALVLAAIAIAHSSNSIADYPVIVALLVAIIIIIIAVLICINIEEKKHRDKRRKYYVYSAALNSIQNAIEQE